MTGPVAAARRTARVLAQAKLNLFLRVLAREHAGHHQIETLFARIDLADDVTVRTGVRGRSLDVAGPELPPHGLGVPERNLAWRAAAAYAEATGWPEAFAIEITKRIPAGGGLGGGSANAGAVLRALDAVAPRGPLLPGALLALAAPLGADVPFLTQTAPLALGWGRGERLLALPRLPVREVCLLLPPFSISTAIAYGWLAADRGEGAPPAPRVLTPAELSRWEAIGAIAQNDFEPVVAARHPEIATSIELLTACGATIARRRFCPRRRRWLSN